MVYLPFYLKWYGIFDILLPRMWKVEILQGIHRRDIGCSSVDFQGYRILMTPSPHPPPPTHTHTPHKRLHHHIIYKPHLFTCMHMNMRSFFCLSATGLSLSMCWSHESGQEFRMIPGLCTMYEVFKWERNIRCKYILK